MKTLYMKRKRPEEYSTVHIEEIGELKWQKSFFEDRLVFSEVI